MRVSRHALIGFSEGVVDAVLVLAAVAAVAALAIGLAWCFFHYLVATIISFLVLIIVGSGFYRAMDH